MSEQEGAAAQTGDIGALKIDPSAEPAKGQAVVVSGQQEVKFYEEGKAEFELEHNKQNLGWIGTVFGGKETSATNIVGLVVVIALLGLLVTAFFQPTPSITELQKILSGVVTTGIGFFAGSAASKK